MMPVNAEGRLLEQEAASNANGPAKDLAVDFNGILRHGISREPWQAMPPLTAEEFAALRNDIAANGVLVPITVDQHGVVIDGHHRQHIANQLGIPCPKVAREFPNDEERHEFALGLNLKRRHLNREQMRQLIAAECDRTPDASDREILGCSPSTVGAVRRPVYNLDTPLSPMEREETEAHTEAIRRHLDQIDQDCIGLLALGMPLTTVAATVMRMWAETLGQINDAEVTDAMWTHIVSPRVASILGGAR